jgi:hypothetical protein
MSEEPNYISLQEATKYCDYSQEYLALRARQGKLKSLKLGKNWVTTKEWLGEYIKGVRGFNSIRKKKEIKKNHQPSLTLAMTVFFISLITSITFGKEGIIKTFGETGLAINKTFQTISEEISSASLINELALEIVSPSEQGFPDGIFEETINTFKDYSQWLTKNIKTVYFATNDFFEKKINQAYRAISQLFKKEEKTPEEELVPQPSEKGLVVIPSTEEDEETIKKIKESFSDEVKIEIKDKTSGVITPVFRSGEEGSYLYILVPIKN